MERKALINQFKQATSGKDFLNLLNALKSEDFGEKAYPFTMTHLRTSCTSHNPKRYKVFTIPKKSGGVRRIAAPSATLKSLLHYTKEILEAFYNPMPCVQGFVIGRSVVGNAQVHMFQNYVFNVDLSDFFPSISQARVWKRLQVAPYNFSKEISSIIAGMSCVAYPREDGTEYHALPQGAPTSPILSNMVCEQMDRRLMGLARRFGLHFSRYADDMTFSSMQNVYQADGEFLRELKRIVTEQGFQFNEKKTRLQKIGQRQEVTGVTVGVKANVSRSYIQSVRSTLHVWEKYGYADAYAWFYKRYKSEQGYRKKGEPVLEHVLEGKVDYLKMVKGDADSTYKSLRKRLDDLIATLYEKRPKRNTRHAKVSYKMVDFHKLFAEATMDFATAPNGYVSGKLTISGVVTPIYFDKFFRNSLPEVKQKILSDIQTARSDWYISEIEDTDKQHKHRYNHFWLISRFEPKIAGQNPGQLDIERLLQEWDQKGLDAAVQLWLEAGKEAEPNKVVLVQTPHSTTQELPIPQQALIPTTSIDSGSQPDDEVFLWDESEATDF